MCSRRSASDCSPHRSAKGSAEGSAKAPTSVSLVVGASDPYDASSILQPREGVALLGSIGLPVRLIVRSVLFNVLFYLNLFLHFIIALPTLVMPRWGIVGVVRWWARTNIWLLGALCDIKVEFRGLAKRPPGALLVASKHQSFWETFALMLVFP